MRERDEDSEKVTVEPPTVEGQASENPADEAKILADQDETEARLKRGVAELEERAPQQLGGDSEEFVRGEVDVVEQMDRRTRQAEDTLVKRGQRTPMAMPPGDNPLPRP